MSMDNHSLGTAHPNFQEMRGELRSSRTKEELTAAFTEWSGKYEVISQMHAPNRPLVGAKAFKKQYGSNKEIAILDAGAGTGLAAIELRKLGYNNMDALEPCEALAEQAMERNIYRKWYQAYMCKERLPIDDDVYDVVYSVGAFGPAAAREDCLEELIRILKPGGQIMIVTGERYLETQYMANFEPRIAELEKEGVLIRKRRDLVPDYIRDEQGDMNGIILILEKPKNQFIAPSITIR